MTELTRRRVLAGATALTSTALAQATMLLPTRAAAPTIGKQVPSFYRQKLGEFEITQISDGSFSRPVSNGFVVNVSTDQAIAATEAAYFDKDRVTIPLNPMVINTGSKLVLIDTGAGAAAYERTKGALGQLQNTMSAADIDPKAIDIIIFSHLHGDHVGGLRTPDGGLAFPNAEIKVPTLDWDFWINGVNAENSNGWNKGHFPIPKKVFAGIESKVTKYEWGKEVAPGITSVATPGHTPGHTSFVVASGSARMLVQSDVTNIPQFFLRNPDWQVEYDNDPNLAVQTRHKFYDMASAEKAMVIGYHWPFPSAGHVEKDGNNYRLIPIAWSSIL